MLDYTSIQADIDELLLKSSLLVAQGLDLKKKIGKENLERCIDPQTEEDEDFRESIIPALCYYTYSRCLKMYQGVMTNGGYLVEGEAAGRNAAKAVANEAYSIAEAFISDVLEDLEGDEVNSKTVPTDQKSNKVRVFGGNEFRASN